MISSVFNTFLYNPLYNALVFLTDIMPGADIGLSVIVLTIVVKVIILPLQHRGRVHQKNTQEKMALIQDEVKDIKKKHAGDKQAEAQATMELYRKHEIKPFSGLLPLLIQFPILLALYWVFIKGIPFTAERLYSFIVLPADISHIFLGIFDLTQRSVLLAIVVALTMYVQMRLSLPKLKDKKKGDDQNFAEDLSRSMNTNMKYVMPAVIGFISLTLPAVVSIYFLTSNIFTIGHELYVKSKDKKGDGDILPSQPLAAQSRES